MGIAADQAFERFRTRFNDFVSNQLKVLLETKHLYQKVSIDPLETIKRTEAEMMPADKEAPDHPKPMSVATLERRQFERDAKDFVSQPLALSDRELFSPKGTLVQCLIVRNVKLFCSAACKTREVFRPIWFHDITSQLRIENAQQCVGGASPRFRINFQGPFQLFSVVLQCQRCEGPPEAFLVRRNKMELFLEGRSPIECVELPSYIPNKENRWLRDAVIAYDSGKTLAGLFYLRTFIEQFARRVTSILTEKKTGEEIMSAYAETIPVRLRDEMPSLRDWYLKLSAAMHSATEDWELFLNARSNIEKHFDFRRLYELDAYAVTEDSRRGEGDHEK